MVEASIYDLKTNLSKFINDLETGVIDSILVTKNGKVVAEISRKKAPRGKIKYGIGKEYLEGKVCDPFIGDEEINKDFMEAIDNNDLT